MSDNKASEKKDEKKEVKKTEPVVYDLFFEIKKTMVLYEKAGKDKDYKLAGSLTK
jgi:hypothetical protein